MTCAGSALENGDDLGAHDQDAIGLAGDKALDEYLPAAALALRQQEGLSYLRVVADVDRDTAPSLGVEGLDHDRIVKRCPALTAPEAERTMLALGTGSPASRSKRWSAPCHA